MFVEKKLMFRRGAPLATDAPAGVTNIIVENAEISATGDEFGNGDVILLMHAPAFGQPKNGPAMHSTRNIAPSGTHPIHGNPEEPRKTMNVFSHALATFAVVGLFGFALSGSAQDRSSVASMSPVTAKLVIPDAKTLPGVPFELWIDVSNDSDATVGVGLCAAMIVQPEHGEEFTVVPRPAHNETSMPNYPVLLPRYSAGDAGVRYLALRPRQRQTITLPLTDAYFHDARLSPPGRYAISMRLDYCVPAWTLPDAKRPADFPGPVTTNEVAIERIVPTGTDAVIWQRMQEEAKGQWAATNWSEGIAGNVVRKEIRAKYRDSAYFPYLVLSDNGPLEATLDAIRRFPDSPVVELLHWSASIAAHDGAMRAAESEVLKKSKRPTTRILVFGREDVKRPCRSGQDCSDD